MLISEKTKAILVRFAKGIISGAVASMTLVTMSQPAVWSDMTTILNTLGTACVYGAVTGFLLALQKWVTWVE